MFRLVGRRASLPSLLAGSSQVRAGGLLPTGNELNLYSVSMRRKCPGKPAGSVLDVAVTLSGSVAGD